MNAVANDDWPNRRQRNRDTFADKKCTESDGCAMHALASGGGSDARRLGDIVQAHLLEVAQRDGPTIVSIETRESGIQVRRHFCPGLIFVAIWILLNHFCRLAFVALPARLGLERVQRDVPCGHQ